VWCSDTCDVQYSILLAIISERTATNKRMQENNGCGKVIHFKLFWGRGMEIMATGQIFLLNYELFKVLKITT
jgi:hypothetical protein